MGDISLTRTLLNIFLKLVLYVGVFFALDFLFGSYIFIPSFLTILIILIYDQKIHFYFDELIGQRFYPNLSKAEKYLTEFNNNINAIVDFQELVNEFYTAFDKIFKEPIWAFYILEKDVFIVQKSKGEFGQKTIPYELELQKNSYGELYFDLRDKKMSSTFKNNEVIETFLFTELDTFIPINGKNQIIALLFTNHKNIQIFQDPELRKLVARVLQKAGNFLENTALYLDVIHHNLETKKLFEVSQKLLSSFNTNEILEFILDSLDEVIPYDAAAIFLLDGDSGELLQKASKGYGEKRNDVSMKIGQGACGWVAQNRKMSLIDNVEYAENYFPIRQQTRSQVALPLLIHDEVLGVLCLEKDELAYFTNNFIELLNIFANQAAIALYNAKQYEISIAKRSLEHELINAGKVQQVLLPKRAPNYIQLDISFTNIPSKIVSGDLFDLIPMDEQHFGVMIGDVAGKGAGAAIMMSLLLAGFRAYNKTRITVCETVARLNNLLEESLSASRYATFFYGVISFNEDTITFTNAGHNPPIILHADGTTEDLFGGGIVLGYLANETYIQHKKPFHQGDLLVLYTDGVTEAMNNDSQEFGEKRLLKVIKENASKKSYEIRENIIKEVKHFTGHNDPDDDATLIVIKYIAR